MNLKKIFSLIFLGLILINIASAQENWWDKTKGFLGEHVVNVTNFQAPIPPGGGEALFIGLKQIILIGPFIGNFFIGLFAGLILYLTYLIILWKRRIVDLKKSNKDDVELSEGRTRWLNFVAGRIHKPLFIGIFFATLMQVPIISTVLKFVTLEYFGYFWYSRMVMLAILIGYIPAIIENFRKGMMKNKLERKVNQARVAATRAN